MTKKMGNIIIALLSIQLFYGITYAIYLLEK